MGGPYFWNDFSKRFLRPIALIIKSPFFRWFMVSGQSVVCWFLAESWTVPRANEAQSSVFQSRFVLTLVGRNSVLDLARLAEIGRKMFRRIWSKLSEGQEFTGSLVSFGALDQGSNKLKVGLTQVTLLSRPHTSNTAWSSARAASLLNSVSFSKRQRKNTWNKRLKTCFSRSWSST